MQIVRNRRSRSVDPNDLPKKKCVNPLLKLYYEFPNMRKYWDWGEISKNECIGMKEIENNMNLPWRWYAVSENPNLTWEFVQKHIGLKWDWDNLSKHPCITWDIIMKTFDKYDWNLTYISENPNITFDIFSANIMSCPIKKGSWNMCSLSKNPGIDWEDIKNQGITVYDDEFNDEINIWERSCFVQGVLENPTLTVNKILRTISEHDNVLNELNDISVIVQKDDFSEDHYDMFLSRGWLNDEAVCHVIEHKNISIDFILKRRIMIANYVEHEIAFSKNPNLTQKHILMIPQEYFSWKTLSEHPCVTMKFVKDHPDFPWDNYHLSLNPNLRVNSVIDNSNLRCRQIHFTNMSINLFTYEITTRKRICQLWCLLKQKHLAKDIIVYIFQNFMSK